MKQLVAVDIGATNTRIAVSADGKRLSRVEKYLTPRSPGEGIRKLSKMIRIVVKGEGVGGVVVGMVGVHDLEKGIVLRSSRFLSQWDGVKLGPELSKALNTEVVIENDAALAALGEAVYGAGRSYKIVAFLTISTGIGGARIIEGKIDQRRYGFEPGQQILERDKGRQGRFEILASGAGFKLRTGIDPRECDDSNLWAEEGKILGQGLVNVLSLWSPDVVVLGGSMTKSWGLFYEPMMAYVRRNFKMFPIPPVVRSKLGDEMGLYGGLALLQQKPT